MRIRQHAAIAGGFRAARVGARPRLSPVVEEGSEREVETQEHYMLSYLAFVSRDDGSSGRPVWFRFTHI